MRHARGKPSRNRALAALGVTSAILAGGGATLAGLWSLGAVDLSFMSGQVQAPSGPTVAVPISARPIAAYSKVTRDHLFDAKSGQITYLRLPPEAVKPEMIVALSDILGRVLDHDKPAGYAFTESDFLPAGTRPGVVAGIPGGKRSLTLQADVIDGVFGLAAGDRVDILATVPIEASPGRATNGLVSAQTEMARALKRASVRVLAHDAVVVQPVTARQKTVTSTSLTRGQTVRTVPVNEIVIAVEPNEVAPITEALATGVSISCIARSGLPATELTQVRTPGLDPLGNVQAVESIRGGRRETLVFPTGLPGRAGEN